MVERDEGDAPPARRNGAPAIYDGRVPAALIAGAANLGSAPPPGPGSPARARTGAGSGGTAPAIARPGRVCA